MTIKTTTALFAALTLAFAAPAFADQTPPADNAAPTEDYVPYQPPEQITAPDESIANPTTFYQATPLQIENEVRGKVITNEDSFAPPQPETPPILGDEDYVPMIDSINSNLDGFDEDNSQLDVDDAKTTITFGAR